MLRAVLGVQLPLEGEHANTRKAAMAVLQAMLTQPELAARRDGSSPVTPDYVRTALARLTGHETVQLLDWADIAPSVPQLSWSVVPACSNLCGQHVMLMIGTFCTKPFASAFESASLLLR